MIRATSSTGPLILAQNGYPFIVPSSGSVAVTTGAITLTTALDTTYPAAYMYFPASTFTGSTAGFYYVTMTTTTQGTLYSTRYTSGIPLAPTSPSVVTTGAGAYVQNTGVVVGQTFTIAANSMGLHGRIFTEINGVCNNSASAKSFSVIFGGSNLGATSVTTLGAVIHQNRLANMADAAKQSYINNNILTGGANAGDLTINTAANVAISIGHQIVAATDYIVSKYVYLELTR